MSTPVILGLVVSGLVIVYHWTLDGLSKSQKKWRVVAAAIVTGIIASLLGLVAESDGRREGRNVGLTQGRIEGRMMPVDVRYLKPGSVYEVHACVSDKQLALLSEVGQPHTFQYKVGDEGCAVLSSASGLRPGQKYFVTNAQTLLLADSSSNSR